MRAIDVLCATAKQDEREDSLSHQETGRRPEVGLDVSDATYMRSMRDAKNDQQPAADLDQILEHRVPRIEWLGCLTAPASTAAGSAVGCIPLSGGRPDKAHAVAICKQNDRIHSDGARPVFSQRTLSSSHRFSPYGTTM